VAERVLVTTDGAIALEGALGGCPGILLIAGTGSVGYARGADGRVERCGGWGMIVGDEGSAWSLGRNGLAAALRAADGRGPHTPLLPQLLEHSPQLVIDHIGFTAPEGEFGIKGTAELPGFHKDDLATPQSRAALMGKIVANADVWISEALLNKDWSGPTEKAEVSNEGPGQAEAMRRQVSAFEQQGFVTRKVGQLHTHIEFKGGALTANGKPLR
jgi:hypothetical protein